MQKIAIHALISGRVQGVWFRQSTKEQADANGVSGWVRNLPDGRVEAVLVGDANGVRLVETWLNQGPPLATVAEVIVAALEPEQPFVGFEVRD
ncbi:MAG TPA: acylphosphatase [Motiliproteus sp.]